ncbi:hypothetical protein TTHERM_01101590 (macronuclear) [Tetrahymena thermophila SB210]|uniref:Transmembrane protein n=1 Tax=Tetrahymena thermophila (strain SB210) TaxID=312017 RepID=Q23RQ2_TETTS|nr:hypothetical protein TTHERM_01101590 [Tetrahymena thermophila SB210]EAR99185.1 hypothetical protein TTHERM_01101590 [Tetrahymena thermophila SB210]|eukprot:XP_001019430.1 hypothetical protein TTHERM_01101590 [Tetrahymena thermophila SB210]
MKFIIFLLISIIALKTVIAASDVVKCLNSVSNPCQPSDSNCNTEKTRVENCVNDVYNDNTLTTDAQISNAIKTKCSSTNSSVQNYIKQSLKCLKSSHLYLGTLIILLQILL